MTVGYTQRAMCTTNCCIRRASFFIVRSPIATKLSVLSMYWIVTKQLLVIYVAVFWTCIVWNSQIFSVAVGCLCDTEVRSKLRYRHDLPFISTTELMLKMNTVLLDLPYHNWWLDVPFMWVTLLHITKQWFIERENFQTLLHFFCVLPISYAFDSIVGSFMDHMFHIFCSNTGQ